MPDVPWLKKALDNNKDARNVFLCTHIPILPVSRGKIEWIPFSKPEEKEKRLELLNMLLERNVIVLCGHIHEQTLLEYANEKGRITQVTAYSVIGSVKSEKNGPLVEGTVEQFKAIPVAKTNMEKDTPVGKLVAERAIKEGITEVVFDRGGYLYHGRVSELAEGAREGGLKF